MVKKIPTPDCRFCYGVPATHVAGQSVDEGETIEWVFCCDGHASGWNMGSDWDAPVYRLELNHYESFRRGD